MAVASWGAGAGAEGGGRARGEMEARGDEPGIKLRFSAVDLTYFFREPLSML